MAQIPGVPDKEPAQIDHRSAGLGGQAIARIGEDIEGMTQDEFSIHNHIREAQKHVDTLAFQNQAHASVLQTQMELEKATDPAQAKAISEQGVKKLNELTEAYAKAGSPAAPELGMYAQSLTPKLNYEGEQRQIKLLTEQLHVETVEQDKTLLPMIVTAIRSNDKNQENAIRSLRESTLDKGVASGLISKAGKKAAMDQFDESITKELNKAVMLSADPKERKAGLEQIEKGGSGPYRLSEMADGDKAALRVSAQEADKTLTERSEAVDENTNLNRFHDIVQNDPALRGNPAAVMEAVEDGGWLVKNGFTAADGSPNRILAKKVLIPEINRQWALKEKEESDKAEKLEEHWGPLIDQNKASRGQIAEIMAESPKAGSALMHQWTQQDHYNKQVAALGKATADAEKKEKSAELKAVFFDDILSGKPVDPLVVKTTAGLSKSDQTQILGAMHTFDTNPTYKEVMKGIEDAGIFSQDADGITKKAETRLQMDHFFREHPTATAVEAGAQLKAILSDNNQEAIGKSLDAQFSKITGTGESKHGFWSGVGNRVAKIGGYKEPTSESNPTPKTGDVVKGYKFKGGDPADSKNWEKQ
jgi:hypothetical protein